MNETNANTITITVTTAAGYTFEDVCVALAEGEHTLGEDATSAGYSLIQWPGNDYGTR